MMDQSPRLRYQHEQNAPQWLVAVVSLIAIGMFSLVMALVRSGEVPVAAALLITMSVGFVFLAVIDATRLTTTITPNELVLHFRLGWPRRVIDRSRIKSATKHRNSRLAGWGIRKVSHGWMWTVWGLDTVELDLDNGGKFRIGTDDAEGLLAALRG